MFWSALLEALVLGIIGFATIFGFPIIGSLLVAWTIDMWTHFTRRRRSPNN